MQTIFVHQRINVFGFLKREKRGFRWRNQTDFAPAIFAPGADKMPFVLENINFAGFDDDFRAYFSHKNYDWSASIPLATPRFSAA
jgi:hypothetical protein